VTDTLEPLVLDFVEWVALHPRQYSEAIETWRTSCPRLTVWEEAIDRGFVRRANTPEDGALVVATALGEKFLRDHDRSL
jgi:hypothetical protein